MSENQFKIYSSSAGSGKTYTLTKEYLKLALKYENPHYFRHILAITFTNDAANEMKSRIVETLREFGQPNGLHNPLLKDIAKSLNQSPEMVQKKARATFNKIIYNYADFAVSTIDSFVNQVIRAFTRELNIPYNYEIQLDTTELLNLAIDKVLDNVGRAQKDELSELIINWVEEKAEQGKNWSMIAEDLKGFAYELLNERSYRYIAQLKSLKIKDYQKIRVHLNGYVVIYEDHVQELAQKALDLIGGAGLGAGDFKGGKTRSVVAYFIKHRDKPYNQEALREKDYFHNATQENIWYKDNLAQSKQALIDAIAPQLADLLEQIESYKETEGKRYILVKRLLPQLYKLALIHEIQEELERSKAETNSIHISDNNKKIAEIIATEPVPYIYERVGERYHHILIDEFQDTSTLQWHNLMPLIENALAENNFNLIVGDAKQAIYRWRGGEMEQLVYLYKKHFERLQNTVGEQATNFLAERYQLLANNHSPERLAYNFRSTPEVINFNNALFNFIVKDSALAQEYDLLKLIYDEGFAQEVPPQNKKSGGLVDIQFIPKKEESLQTLEEIRERVAKAIEDGFAPEDIAILVRANLTGKTIAQDLRQHGYRVISQTSLLLVSSEKVRFIVALMKLIHKPEDKMNKSEAMYLFYKVVRKQIPDAEANEEISQILNSPIGAFYEKIKAEGFKFSFYQLQSLSLYELAEQLIGIFDLMKDQYRLEYVFRFLDVVLEFSQQKSATLGEFLQYWEEKREKLSINTPKSKGAIAITTIHKSKGLEYPVVIVPFFNIDLSPKNQSTMWVQLEDEIFTLPKSTVQLPVGIVGIAKELAETHLAKQYQDELERVFIENLNLMYVAFTRPVYRLHILCKGEDFSKQNPCKNVACLIHQYLKSKGEWREDQAYYELSDSKVAPYCPPPQNVEEDDAANFWIEEFVSTDVHKKLRISKGTGRKAKI